MSILGLFQFHFHYFLGEDLAVDYLVHYVLVDLHNLILYAILQHHFLLVWKRSEGRGVHVKELFVICNLNLNDHWNFLVQVVVVH